MVMENGQAVVDRVSCAIDCGIVVNPDGATNMAEGAIVDGIGVAMYGNLSFNEGVPDKDNLDTYELARISDAPRTIDVHFVKNEIPPTGMGEPPFPPVMAALANALYGATGKRHYHQPFINGT
jgi:isoquinoline 1-oxidoreductase beta subunit